MVQLAYIEVARMLLQLYFSLLEKAGSTPEEQSKMFEEELLKFQSRSPENLPDVK